MQRKLKIALILLSLIHLYVSVSYSQMNSEAASLKWGANYNEPLNTQISKILAITPKGFYSLREKVLSNPNARPKIYLEYFTRDMKLIKSNVLDLKYKGKQRDFEDIIMLGGQLYLLTSYNNVAKKKNFLFKQPINMKTLTPSKNLKMILETEARNKEREGTFDYHISRDSSKMLIYNQLPYKRKEPERFALRVYDNDFEKIWSKNIKLPYPDNQLSIEEYRVDNEGNVFLLGVLFKDEAKYRRRGSPNYEYVILAYRQGGDDAEEYHVGLKDKFITDLTFRVADDGDLVCTGFYSERGTYSIKGTYFFRLNSKTKQIYNENSKEFNFEFLSVYMSPKDKKRAKKAASKGNFKRQAELYQYALDELILRSDGGAVLVAEQFYVYQQTDQDYFYPSYYGYSSFYSPFQTTTTYYNYNDIIIVNIKPNGEIEWASRIPKQQSTTDDGGIYSSYSMAIVRDKLFFVFNDNARNLGGAQRRRGSRTFNFSGNNSVIVVAEVRKDGSVETFPVNQNNRNIAAIAQPKVSKQIGRKEMAIYGENGRQFMFGSLTFK